jgi:hypothetical protein
MGYIGINGYGIWHMGHERRVSAQTRDREISFCRYSGPVHQKAVRARALLKPWDEVWIK